MMMNLISMNLRGLRGRIKRKYLSDLIRSEQVGMVCLHETTCSEFGKENCYLLWGSNDIAWVQNGASNNAGDHYDVEKELYFKCLVLLM